MAPALRLSGGVEVLGRAVADRLADPVSPGGDRLGLEGLGMPIRWHFSQSVDVLLDSNLENDMEARAGRSDSDCSPGVGTTVVGGEDLGAGGEVPRDRGLACARVPDREGGPEELTVTATQSPEFPHLAGLGELGGADALAVVGLAEAGVAKTVDPEVEGCAVLKEPDPQRVGVADHEVPGRDHRSQALDGGTGVVVTGDLAGRVSCFGHGPGAVLRHPHHVSPTRAGDRERRIGGLGNGWDHWKQGENQDDGQQVVAKTHGHLPDSTR